MKAVLAALVLFMATSAFADSTINGKILYASPVVRVKTPAGEIKEYLSPKSGLETTVFLKDPSASEKSGSVSFGWGALSRCSPYIGQLVSELMITIQREEDGSAQVLTVLPATEAASSSSQSGSVNVYGTCQGTSNQLDEISIETTLQNFTFGNVIP